MIEHATILCDSGPIRREHLPQRFDSRQLVGAARQRPGVMTLREIEMQAIHDALERTGGNKPKAAEELDQPQDALQQAESGRLAGEIGVRTGAVR